MITLKRIENYVLYHVYNEDINADGSFIVPNGVTSIGDYAFFDCSSLTSVIIPDSVTSIGHHAFSGCTRLTSIIIPNGVTSIEKGTFELCSNLTSVTIGNGVTSIGYSAFDGCSGLTSVTLPESIKSIGECAFWGCNSLTSIAIPNSVTSIASREFVYCTSLISVTIPDGVTSIEYGAFVGCSRLTSKRENYKAFALTEKGKLICRDKTYTVGKKTMVDGKLELCENGIHYCTNLFDIFSYYHGEYGKDFVIGVCEVSDEKIGGGDDSKRCARWVKPTRILAREEVIKIMNGDRNNET